MMNPAHLHLVVNHFPIIFPITGVLIMIAGLIFKSEPVKRTAYMVFILGALTAVAAMLSGEEAEEVVENMSGVTENYLESHEAAAERFSVLSYMLGGFSLLGLWASVKEKSFSFFISIGALAFAIVALVFGAKAGTTGGEIRHTEIRSSSSISNIENTSIEKEDDD
jgi:uncharacterized membrane protein